MFSKMQEGWTRCGFADLAISLTIYRFSMETHMGINSADLFSIYELQIVDGQSLRILLSKN